MNKNDYAEQLNKVKTCLKDVDKELNYIRHLVIELNSELALKKHRYNESLDHLVNIENYLNDMSRMIGLDTDSGIEGEIKKAIKTYYSKNDSEYYK